MHDWTSLRVEDLVTSISSGGTPRAGDLRYYAESGTPFLKIDDVTKLSGRFVFEAEQSITEAALNETATKIHPIGTVLVTMYGTIGVVKTLGIPMATNQAILALIPPFNCNSDYLAHALSFHSAELEGFAAQTTQPNISAKIIRMFKIAVPPLEEQRRIAEVLDTLDAIIQATESVILKLQAVRIGVIEDKLLIEDAIPLSSLAKVTVGFVGPTQMHYTTHVRGVPFLRTGNIGRGEIRTTDLRYITHEFNRSNQKSILQAGDVVVSRVGYTGTAAVIGQNLAGSNCANMIIIRPNLCLDSEFLSLLFESWFIRRQVEAMTAGSAQPVFNIQLVERLLIPRIELDDQRRMVEIVKKISRQIVVEQEWLNKLVEIRSGLAADLLSGWVRTVAA